MHNAKSTNPNPKHRQVKNIVIKITIDILHYLQEKSIE